MTGRPRHLPFRKRDQLKNTILFTAGMSGVFFYEAARQKRIAYASFLLGAVNLGDHVLQETFPAATSGPFPQMLPPVFLSAVKDDHFTGRMDYAVRMIQKPLFLQQIFSFLFCLLFIFRFKTFVQKRFPGSCKYGYIIDFHSVSPFVKFVCFS